jgi:hypothetical protein
MRRAQSRKPATYRCPFCDRFVPAFSEHVLISPEGDMARRRHAHTACALVERKAGRLPIREEWLREQPPPPSGPRSWLRRALGR